MGTIAQGCTTRERRVKGVNIVALALDCQTSHGAFTWGSHEMVRVAISVCRGQANRLVPFGLSARGAVREMPREMLGEP